MRSTGTPMVLGIALATLLPATPSPAQEAGIPVVRFHVAQRRVQHQRHVRKYVEGELPPERSFFFRGPERALNLRAANLARFVELAEGVDEGTWRHHLDHGDYATWLQDMVKDPTLAAEVRALQAARLAPGESRRRVLDLIRARYSV